MKILIVDDHPIVRAGLRRLLAAEPGTEIHEAADGKEALAAFREQRPDLVILDLNLPGIGGIEVILRLRTADPGARVLILSMHDDQIHVTRALQAGACGYVSKQAPPDEILMAIGRVAAGGTYVEHDIAEELVFANIPAPSHPLKELTWARSRNFQRLVAEGAHPAANRRYRRHQLQDRGEQLQPDQGQARCGQHRRFDPHRHSIAARRSRRGSVDVRRVNNAGAWAGLRRRL